MSRYTSKHTGKKIDDTIDNVVNPNLLDNWYFGNPVNQRGQTSYTGAGYGIDRWRQQADGTVLINQDGLQFNGLSYVATYLDFNALSYLLGKQVTLSVLYKNALSGKMVATDWYGNEQKSVLLTSGSEGLAQATFTIPSDATEFRYIIGANTPEQTKEWYTIQAVKLELGTQQTLAHQKNGNWVLNEIPDYGEQLRRCQYYSHFFGDDIEIPCSNNPAGTAIEGTLPLTMRSGNGTITFQDGYLFVENGTYYKVTSASVSSNGGRVKIRAIVDTTLSSNLQATLYFRGCSISFDL